MIDVIKNLLINYAKDEFDDLTGDNLEFAKRVAGQAAERMAIYTTKKLTGQDTSEEEFDLETLWSTIELKALEGGLKVRTKVKKGLKDLTYLLLTVVRILIEKKL